LSSGAKLTPVRDEKQKPSRNFTLSVKGYVDLELEWSLKNVVEISCGQIKIDDLEQNNLVSSHRLSKTLQFSKFGVELDAGKYQITLFNTQEVCTLLSAIFNTNQGLN
jgi:hypothetical protein